MDSILILEMYAENNYEGQEALMVNCLTMGMNLVTFSIYFLHGEEYIKFWISLVVFMMMALGGLVWLVWHPNIIHSDERKIIFKKNTEVFGGIGMALFAVMNVLPFIDLWAMTFGDRVDFFTLLVPNIINTFLGTIAGSLWTMYAWLFVPRHPNLFMFANCMATAMTFLQAMWLLILRFKDTEVEGMITEVESLRSALKSVSSSFHRLETASDGVWNKNSFLSGLVESVQTGGQSLVLMRMTFVKLQADLKAKTDADAAAIAVGANPNEGANPNVAALRTLAASVRDLYPHLLQACQGCGEALEVLERALKDILTAGHARAGVEVARAIAGERELKSAIKTASEALAMFADSLKPCMPVINALEGIPATLRFAFDYCREKMFVIKITVESELLI